MSDASEYLQSFRATPAPAALIDASTRWHDVDDDLALGCECAYPALQIERWGQEEVALASSAS